MNNEQLRQHALATADRLAEMRREPNGEGVRPLLGQQQRVARRLEEQEQEVAQQAERVTG